LPPAAIAFRNVTVCAAEVITGASLVPVMVKVTGWVELTSLSVTVTL